jgi:chemotaxis receptor (MCP) glutamine deamidase CheD
MESIDTDLENGETKEKTLTADSKVAIRAEKMDLSATDTEGKATGSVSINAKAVSVKSMDVEKEKRTDDKLAEGSTMTIVAEKMYVGAKSKDVKSKKVQVVSEEIGAFADKTLEIQQDEGKALVQLSGGNASLGGSKTQVYGETTINAKTEVKDEIKAPKATIDNLEAKTSFKSQNIQDGMGVSAGGGGGSLSAKLKTEDAPKD